MTVRKSLSFLESMDKRCDFSRPDISRVAEVTYATREMVARPRVPEYCFQSIPREPDEWRCHSAVLWDKQVTAARINVVRYCLAPRNGKWLRCSLRRGGELAAAFSNLRVTFPYLVSFIITVNVNFSIIII